MIRLNLFLLTYIYNREYNNYKGIVETKLKLNQDKTHIQFSKQLAPMLRSRTNEVAFEFAHWFEIF